MTCIQRDLLYLLLPLLVLIHIQQTVNSYQDETLPSHDWTNRLRHHHVPLKYRRKLQQVQPFTTPPTLSPWKTISRRKSPSGHVNHRIEEARHAFGASRIIPPHRPTKPNSWTESKLQLPVTQSSQWHHKITVHPTKPWSPVVEASQTRKKPTTDKGTERRTEIDEYYYYGDDDIDDALDAKGDISLERDEDDNDDDDDDDDGAPISSWEKPTLDPKTAAIKYRRPSLLSDDYNFDYLDDEPTNGTGDEPGSLTEKKWENYGTVEAVETSWRRHQTEARFRVEAHIARIHLEATCKVPRPKIIQMNDASKRYIPHCTLLHRCSDETGCCDSDTHTCVAKKTTTVDLYFYVILVGSRDTIIEAVQFINHTECHCVDRNGVKRGTTEAPDSFSDDTNKSDSRNCTCIRNFDVFQENLADDSEYSLNVQGDSRTVCRCDCLSDNQSCLRMKKGLEGFSVEDRRCITSGRCTMPTCQFGEYSKRSGRCPKTQSKRTSHDTW